MKKEILAYAITHAPKGVKGGPYEGEIAIGTQVHSLREATRWLSGLPPLSQTLRAIQKVHPHARVIRIVRKARLEVGAAKESAAFEAETWREASAVEVLRELVAVLDRWNDDTLPVSRLITACNSVEMAARCVLAASGPDPLPVVRAAMAWRDWGGEGTPWTGLARAVDAYRKAGGK